MIIHKHSVDWQFNQLFLKILFQLAISVEKNSIVRMVKKRNSISDEN